MKAVIMAGGKGTRLCPLTCFQPKPMVPLLGRPCMEYIIELLKRHGIFNIAVTLQFLPQVIKSHFGDGAEYGVHLTYFEETTPLGTAGSVKNAEEFLDDTFVVISGDALTDFNLSQAIDFHRRKQTMGTLVLTKVNVPLEYGVVMTEEDGRIIRFLEKPSWSEVFSDTVNTGIYVLEPEILKLFPREKEYDFSKDLFPLVMEREQDLYGFVAQGYWSDIGSHSQYRQAQFDMLLGEIQLPVNGFEEAPGMWFEEEIKIPADAKIEGPSYIGRGTIIDPGAVIGPYTIMGRYNRVCEGAYTEHTVMWNHNYLGKAVSLSGATLGNGIYIGAGSRVYDNAVIGEKTVVKDLAVIKPGVKIWPEKTIAAGTVQSSSLIWGGSVSSSLFGSDGISGIPNWELTPEFIGKVASAYGSRLRLGVTVCVSCDEDYYNKILKFSVISSLLATGVKVRDIGTTVTPIARFECRHSHSDGAIHIRQGGGEGVKTVCVQFFDREGLPIDKDMERKIENAYLQEDFTRPNVSQLGLLEQVPATVKHYLEEILSRVDLGIFYARRYKVVYHCSSPLVVSILSQLLDSLGCEAMGILNGTTPLAKVVMDNKADLGIELDTSGQNMRLVTEKGKVLSEEELLVLKTLTTLKNRSPIAIPVTAPSILDNMMEEAGVSVVRTKAVPRSLLEVGKNNSLQVHYDSFYSLVSIMEYLIKTGTNLHSFIEELPEFYISMRDVICPFEAKGRVMRCLMEEIKDQNTELIDGIKVLTDDAWALILPDSEKALFKVVAQGISRSKAEELTEKYKNKIIAYSRYNN
ncbi:MAG: D-glycero-alpha-D-manno-heptose 1-phosphate guanylyltransferase [Pelotomaculum sp. PtaB.Bin013]|uniref:NTP transferase domain-containing protein n=1 Tax=Pelotomaculum isophthalicicum JI TaxID=947010 RepID=A0A9X4JWT6_9FIRM|nr:sugar phosphate nucleotidyltransferase [Pelotomaculum isophthalicicum]MDF9410018.1 NTP transferase domain-containing protein [Pelotomaculum isophthalicicum JI]OPX88722.1 MAG: D-glycero-alpha-D-manno-heptose 1-phosphate guanylyltransferase [Pelotomaculum sp. PtaB.Bin013]